VAVANKAFATLVVNGTTGFYRVNQLAGTAILIDTFSGDKTDDFSDPVIDIAIQLKQSAGCSRGLERSTLWAAKASSRSP
jgi:hypothetical protein